VSEPWGWNVVAGRSTAPQELNSNWVQIPHETMRDLHQNAQHQHPVVQPIVGLPNTGQFTGYPVHLIDGKWYVDLTPRGVLISPNEARELLKIQKHLEQGDWEYDAAADRIRVWDAEQWLVIPMELVHRIQDAGMVAFLQEGEVIPERHLRSLKEALVEHEEEAERLALRQLLAESQSEEDEGDGDD